MTGPISDCRRVSEARVREEHGYMAITYVGRLVLSSGNCNT